jgi:lipid-A-disaccharide synthase
MKKVFILVGEASGDLHASNLVKEMNLAQPFLQWEGWGGDLLQKQGVQLRNHIRNLSFMGFLEVILNIRTILNNFKLCKEQIESFQPDMLLLVDYPGFNLRMAKWAKSRGIPVTYYISPQIWAWKASRIKIIKETVDKMYCILPFEKAYYEKEGFDVSYFGHPLIDAKQNYEHQKESQPSKSKGVLAILPGSREQEVKRKLKVMLEAASKYTEFNAIVACAPNLPSSFYTQYKEDYPFAEFVFGKTYDLLSIADFAIVTSGTATLETAIFRVPQVVCYKSSYLSYKIAKFLVNIRFISLVNLIMDKEIVVELIQNNVSRGKIQKELDRLIYNSSYRETLLNAYDEMIDLLGNEGCSKKIARDLLGFYSK